MVRVLTPGYQPSASKVLLGKVAALGTWRHLAWFPKLGYLVGVLIIRESYYLGVYVGGSPTFINPTWV